MRIARRSGFALAIAVCLLAAVGGLAGASFLAVLEARRGATRLARQEDAAGVADRGLFTTLAGADARAIDSMRIGTTDSLAPRGSYADSAARVYVTRITEALYWVTVLGQAGLGTSTLATRAHSLLVRSVRPEFPVRAMILSRGDVLIGRDAQISVADQPPPGWSSCPPPDTGLAAAIVIPEGQLARDETGSALTGVLVDPVAALADTYRVFGRLTMASLVDRADIAVRPGAMLSSPLLDDGISSVIHAAGDIVVTAARGRGLMLVDGRLRIEGPFVFYGVIVASGGIEASGSDVSLYGAVLSAGEGGVVWRATGHLQRSTCAVAHAAAGAAQLLPLPRRAWSEVF